MFRKISRRQITHIQPPFIVPCLPLPPQIDFVSESSNDIKLHLTQKIWTFPRKGWCKNGKEAKCGDGRYGCNAANGANGGGDFYAREKFAAVPQLRNLLGLFVLAPLPQFPWHHLCKSLGTISVNCFVLLAQICWQWVQMFGTIGANLLAPYCTSFLKHI